MTIDCLLAQEEDVRDRLVGLARGEKQQYLEFPRAEAVCGRRGAGFGPRHHRVDRRDVRGRVELHERLLCHVEFSRSAVDITERVKRPRHENPDARAEVWSPYALPDALGVPERVDRT